MTDIFISYSRKDKAFVRKVFDALESRGYEIWVDWQDIPLTADWWREIQKGIDSANHFIFVISPDSISSEVCNDEIDYALSNNKRFVPLLYRDISTTSETAHAAISSHNWIFANDESQFDEAINKLLVAMVTDLQHVRQHTRLLVRAREWDNSGRNDSLLLRGDELRQAEAWLTVGVNKDPAPTDLQAEYIAASRAAQVRLQRTIFTMVSIALIVAIGLSILSFILYQNANVERARADQNAATAIIAQGEAVVQAETAIAAQETSEENARQLDIANATSESRANETYNAFLTYRANQMIADNPILALALAVEANQNEQRSVEDLNTLMISATSSTIRTLFDGFISRVVSVSYSPDGRLVAGGSFQGNLQVWDVTTGRRVLNARIGYQILNIEFSLDGEYVYIASSRNIVGFDLTSGERLAPQFMQDEAPSQKFFDLEFSSDGQYLAIATEHQGVMIWDSQTADMVTQLATDITPTHISFGANDATLLVGSLAGDNNLSLWDIASSEIIQSYDGLDGNITGLDFSPDGEWFVAGDDQSQQAQLWHISVSKPYACLCDNASEVVGVRDLAFSPDGKHIAVLIDNSASPNIWTIEEGILRYERGLWKEPYFEFLAEPMVSAFSPDGGHLLVGGFGMMYVFDTYIAPVINSIDLMNDSRITQSHLQNLPMQLIRSQQELITRSAFMNSILVDAESGKAFIIDIPSSQTEVTIHNFRTNEFILTVDKAVEGVVVAPDNQSYVYVDARDAQLHTVDIDTGETLLNFELSRGDYQGISHIAFDDDGTLLAAGTGTGVIFVWNAETGELKQRLNGHIGAVNQFKFSHDGQFLVSAAWDHTVIIWNLESGTLHQRLTAHQDNISSLDISPDNQIILSTSPEIGIVLWDAETGRSIGRIPSFSNEQQILVGGFVADGRVVSVDKKGLLTYWQPQLIEGNWLKWVYQNRYILELSCEQRAEYNVQPECDDFNRVPTVTPYPTALVAPTVVNTLEFVQVPLETPVILPTVTPTMTLNPANYVEVSGRITYQGHPMPDVPVMVYWDEAGGKSENLVTDSNGFYHVDNVAKDVMIEIKVRPPISEGLAWRHWGIPRVEGDIVQNFALEQGYRFQGMIINPDGTAFIPDGNNDWLDMAPQNIEFAPNEWFGVFMTNTGEFDTVAPPGIYRLSVFNLRDIQLPEIEVDLRGGNLTNVRIELEEAE